MGRDRRGRDPAPPPRHTARGARLAEARRRGAASLGLSVAILVSTGIPLFALRGLTEVGLVPFNEDTATFLALAIDLPLVALGVIMLLTRSRLFANVKHLVDLEFTPDPIVTAWAARLRLEHEDRRMRRLAIAVGLWICAALPLAVVQALPPIGVGMGVPAGADNGTLNGGDLSELALALSVVLVALGLWIFLPANWAVQTQQTLIREGRQGYDYDEEDYRDPVIGIVASVYWPCVIVAYFVWGPSSTSGTSRGCSSPSQDCSSGSSPQCGRRSAAPRPVPSRRWRGGGFPVTARRAHRALRWAAPCAAYRSP